MSSGCVKTGRASAEFGRLSKKTRSPAEMSRRSNSWAPEFCRDLRYDSADVLYACGHVQEGDFKIFGGRQKLTAASILGYTDFVFFVVPPSPKWRTFFAGVRSTTEAIIQGPLS